MKFDNYYRKVLLLCVVLLCTIKTGYTQQTVRHFIFFSQDREGIHDPSFYNNQGISGAQITYPWKNLEPSKDKYDFSKIEKTSLF